MRRVASDAVLISINFWGWVLFWGMGVRREKGGEGSRLGLGLFLGLGGWGKGTGVWG